MQTDNAFLIVSAAHCVNDIVKGHFMYRYVLPDGPRLPSHQTGLVHY